jgi:hypothetical protein
MRASLAQQGLPDARNSTILKNGDIVRYTVFADTYQAKPASSTIVLIILSSSAARQSANVRR